MSETQPTASPTSLPTASPQGAGSTTTWYASLWAWALHLFNAGVTLDQEAEAAIKDHPQVVAAVETLTAMVPAAEQKAINVTEQLVQAMQAVADHAETNGVAPAAATPAPQSPAKPAAAA